VHPKIKIHSLLFQNLYDEFSSTKHIGLPQEKVNIIVYAIANNRVKKGRKLEIGCKTA